jgi:hypothetical protein
MTWLDEAIKAIAPRWALRRRQARQALRQLEVDRKADPKGGSVWEAVDVIGLGNSQVLPGDLSRAGY